MRDLDDLFAALQRSGFRARFKLGRKESAYLHNKGLPEIINHAREIIIQRLAAAQPANDGKQTPMRNHPVFIAQHATATCCRGCLEKWHHIARGHALSAQEIEYIVQVIGRWLREHAPRPDRGPDLFSTD